MSAITDFMIETVDLRVDYGDTQAVRDVDLSVARGEIFGLIGPNGAGKTSTIRVLTGLLEPTYGEARIGGIDVFEAPEKVYEIMGYMPDFAPVYDDLTVWEFLDLFAGAYGLEGKEREQRVHECTEIVDLTFKRDDRCGDLSRGMTQRLVLAKTMLSDPELLILDEPASGLDPKARLELRQTLTGLAARGKTILISSHILTELSEFCTSIGIMERGRLVVAGRIEDVIKQFAPHREFVVEVLADSDDDSSGGEAGEGAVQRAVQQISARDDVRDVSVEQRTIAFTFDGDERAVAALLAELVGNRVPVTAFFERKMDVEGVFMKVGAQELA